MAGVTEADRRAAASTYQRFRDYDFAGWILEGKCDTDSTVQAFAAHREAAEKVSDQAVVTWLREAAWIRGELGDFDVPEMRRELAQAIERGDHRKG